MFFGFNHSTSRKNALKTEKTLSKGQNERHVDMIWPLWNLFDLTPEGRGGNWFPRLSY